MDVVDAVETRGEISTADLNQLARALRRPIDYFLFPEDERDHTMPNLTLDDARRVSAAAEKKATELGVAATVTIVDSGGYVRTQNRMDGARFGTVSVSTSKAFTPSPSGRPRAS